MRQCDFQCAFLYINHFAFASTADVEELERFMAYAYCLDFIVETIGKCLPGGQVRAQVID